MKKTFQLPEELKNQIKKGHLAARDVMRHFASNEKSIQFPSGKAVDDTALRDLKIGGKSILKALIDRETGEIHFELI